MPNDNKNLGNARQAKFDEFYTQYIDIQKEVNLYLEYNPNECLGSHKTVTLDKLKKIGAEKCAFEDLKQTVYGMYENEKGIK